MTTELNRRDFLKSAGAAGVGLTVYFTIPAIGRDGLVEAAAKYEPNAFITITPDGLVTVHVLKAEMGQGVGTALAQVVAEELESDWKDMRIDYPMADPKYGLMLTGGSWSINWTFDSLSRAAAGARMALIDAAATSWKVPASECVAVKSTVRHLPTGRVLSYGEIVAKAPITKTFSEEDLKKITLKKPSEYKVIGQWVQRLDIPEKTNGKAKFGIDMFVPNMAYAKTAYPPTREGAKVTAVDDSAAKKVPGYLKTVRLPDMVAVVATSYAAAVKARDALKITWDPGPNVNVTSASIFADYEKKAKDPGAGIEWHKTGNPNAGPPAKTHQASFMTDYVAHMQMEPMNCVASFKDGVYDLYSGSQFQTMAMGALAAVLKVPQTNIRLHQTYLGGGFGRRLEPDVILEAALIAREAGRPIKLIRSREEDLQRDVYRSATYQVLKAGMDGTGKIVTWDATVVSGHPGGRWGPDFLNKQGLDDFALNGADHVYDIPNQVVHGVRAETGISVGYVRAVAPNYTFFAVETFVDELAHMNKVDPVTYRLDMLNGAPRLANVLRMVAERSGIGKTPLAPNTGIGVACVSAQEKKTPTWTATAIQAKVDPATGNVKVEKIICAVDCGIVVNPDGVRSQVEGSLLFGLSNATKEKGTVAKGTLEQRNFDTYQVLRLNEVPDVVEVHVVQSTEYPTGVGEPGATTIGPALSNAIFAATGARVRQLPIQADRVLRAIQQKA
ncbi:MAG TPA: molybdopterin cofactor-binding domain-containing protein [Methylomirabilota bacterium]|nr:molybdopterin cofactor-binding domain-containing protein [Methylomirabilota bacterium]